MPAETLMEDLLRHLRQQFYYGQTKPFQQQRKMLQEALTTPAAWLYARGVTLSEPRLREILMEIITGIKRHGDTGSIRFFAGYFLNCVQKHMKFNGDRYYQEGKAARNQVEKAMGAITAVPQAPVDNTCERLADLNRLVKAGAPKKRARKEPCRAVAQTLPGLFKF